MSATPDGLLARADASSRTARVLDATRRGGGASLIVTGAPGVGRSSVLKQAELDGLRVLDVAGTDGASLPVLLAGAAPGSAAGPRRARSARATLSAAEGLLATLAPLVLRVDDAERLDLASHELLAALGTRAPALGVGLLVAWAGPAELPAAWHDLEIFELGELPRADALVLARRAGLPPPVAEALVAAVGGNPSALTTVAGRLEHAQREGREPLPTPLPLGARLTISFASRMAPLGPAARALLLLVATSRDAAAGPVLRAAGEPSALRALEDAGLVRADGRRICVDRPLTRVAVLAAATPGARRAAHRALAGATVDGTRAWHLAAAAERPDEPLAAALEAHGYEQQALGSAGDAASFLERAAALTPDPATASRRGVAAAAATLVAGRPARVGALLEQAQAGARDPGLRADVQLLRGMAMQQMGRPMAAFALLEAAADEVVPHDPARAAGLLTQAGVALLSHGPMDRLLALSERAMALASGGGEIVPAVLHAAALASLGEHTRARTLLRARHAALHELDPTGPGHEILTVAALCHLWMEDLEDCERLLTWLVATGRERSAVAALAFPLCVLASLNLRLGAFDEASRLSAEALALGEGASGTFPHSVVLTTAAFVAAHVGDEDACAAYAEAAQALGLRLGLTTALACAEQALGFLALGLGDAQPAVVHLERALEHTRRFGSRDPSFLYSHADAVEANVRAGDTERAAALTDELAKLAAHTGGAWAAAATARCRALLAPADELDGLLATALAAHERVNLPFERARTHLCFGERLRRARRRTDAREHLATAQATFTALGAAHWARRAEQELRAVGPGPAAASVVSLGELTPREREVCALIARGATNREAAATLYLSPRTVEHHLRTAYRKLGLRSRSELTARWRAS